MGSLLYIVCVFILIIALEEILEAIYRHTDSYKRRLGDAGKFVEGVPDDLEIVNIGSGPGLYAITYDNCKKKGFNFSTAPQNYKYGFRILEKYADNIKQNAIIIIIIMCPLSFGDNNDYARKGYSDKYYYFLDKNQIDDYSIIRKIIINHQLIIRIWNMLKRKIKNILKGKKNLSTQSVEKKGVSSIVQTWKREFNLKDLEDASQGNAHKKAFDEKIQILQNGIQKCKDHGWHPILVVPPIPPKTREFISDSFMDTFVYQNLERVRGAAEDVVLLDYFDDPRFQKIDYYANDIFMNRKGSLIFSDALFEDVFKEEK